MATRTFYRFLKKQLKKLLREFSWKIKTVEADKINIEKTEEKFNALIKQVEALSQGRSRANSCARCRPSRA